MSQGNQQSDVSEDSGRVAGNGMTESYGGRQGYAGEPGYAGREDASTSQIGTEQAIDADSDVADADSDVVVVEAGDLDEIANDSSLDDDVIVDGVVLTDDHGEPSVPAGDEQNVGTLGAQTGNGAGTAGAGQAGAPRRDSGLDADAAPSPALPAGAPGVADEGPGYAPQGSAVSPGADSAIPAERSRATAPGHAAAPTAAAQDISQPWHEIQAMFVDDPPGAVELAAAAANDAVTALVGVIKQRQESLLRAGGQEPGGDSTEQLRSALQDYRALFQSLETFAGQLSSPAGSSAAPANGTSTASAAAGASGAGMAAGSTR